MWLCNEEISLYIIFCLPLLYLWLLIRFSVRFVNVCETGALAFASFHFPLFSGVSRWCGGAAGRALDLRSTGRGFNFYSRQSCVTTLGKLFVPMCLCHQAV